MGIQYRDYYEILGLPRGAGDEEVRRAFRRLARVYHPDKAGGDRRAEDRFKEINEAYEVLGDPRKRLRYDEFNTTWQARSADAAWERFTRAHDGSTGEAGGSRFTVSGSGFSAFFDELFGDSPPQPRAAGDADENDGRGDDLEADLFVTLDEVAQGAIRQVTLRRAARCGACLGLGQIGGASCQTCGGSGAVPANVACKVKVPRGIREGALLRIAGHGDEGGPGSLPGDLFLKVCYRPHSEFRFEHGSLHYDLDLAPWEAVLGVEVAVPALDGRVAIKVPPGTQNGQKLRVRGRGLPSPSGGPGDLCVQIKVQVPSAAPDREKSLWEQLARESAFQPRAGLPGSAHHQH